MDPQVRRQTTFSRPATSRARRSSRISQDSSRAFSCSRYGNGGIGSSSRGRSYGKLYKNGSSSGISSQSGSSRRSSLASSGKKPYRTAKVANISVPKAAPRRKVVIVDENDVPGNRKKQQFPRHASQPAGLTLIPKGYVRVILPLHIAEEALKRVQQEDEQRTRLGPPILLNFDEPDADMDSAYEQSQNDTSGHASDCSRADPQENSPLFGKVSFPLSPFAPKGPSYRWQQNHPGWRDGRYHTDPPPAFKTPAACNQSFLQTQSAQSGRNSRGSESPAFGDPKYYSQSSSPASNIPRRFLPYREHGDSCRSSTRTPDSEVYQYSDVSGANESQASRQFYGPRDATVPRKRDFEVYNDYDNSDANESQVSRQFYGPRDATVPRKRDFEVYQDTDNNDANESQVSRRFYDARRSSTRKPDFQVYQDSNIND